MDDGHWSSSQSAEELLLRRWLLDALQALSMSFQGYCGGWSLVRHCKVHQSPPVGPMQRRRL